MEGLHPECIMLLTRGLLYTPIDFGVIEGVRETERQRLLVANGDSWTMDSFHLIQPDGFGYAFDVMVVGDINRDGLTDHRDKKLTWARGPYTHVYKAMQRAGNELRIGFTWGGHYKSVFDGPHFNRLRR